MTSSVRIGGAPMPTCRLSRGKFAGAYLKRNLRGFAEWIAVSEPRPTNCWSKWVQGARVSAACSGASWRAVKLPGHPASAAIAFLLEERSNLRLSGAQRFSLELLELWAGLWTFVRVSGVEPTNNVAEPALCPMRLWHKAPFVHQNEGDNEAVERMLTVQATCKPHERHL